KAWKIADNPPSSAPVPVNPAAAPPDQMKQSPAAAPPDRLKSFAKAASQEAGAAAHEEPLAPTVLAYASGTPSAEDAAFALSAPASPMPESEEESIPWENLAGDTKDLTNEVDTAPPPPKKGSSRKLGRGKPRMSA